MKYCLVLISFCLFFAGVALAQPQVPTGRAITVVEILTLTQSFGGFLIALGGILATITIIVTGFMYLTSGSNTQRVTTAKNMFKAGIIGALIIFSTGLIINTIRGFATNPLQFFGGGGSGGGGYNLPNGSVCSSGNDCQSAYCNLTINPSICQ